jgi:hypothetical protein
MSFFALGVAGAALPMHLNGALDRSRPTNAEGKVAWVGEPDDEDGLTRVTVRWADGRFNDYRLSRVPKLGDRVTQVLHRGALRFTWRERPVFD